MNNTFIAELDGLYSQSCSVCGGFSNSAEHKVTFSPDALIKGLEAIFDGFNVKDEIQSDIFTETLRLFNLAAAKGISESHNEDVVTDEFLEQVRHNNEVFSAFRTHRMQNDIAAQLIDADGHLKSWDKFRKDVAPLTGKYCQTWLNTEYNTAIIRAHRAADWKHFVDEQDVYPNLRWMPTTSVTPDPVHEQFWSKKLTLPVNDPFWGHHHPGERWGCKCTCEQTDEPVNDFGLSEAPKDTASKGLKGNPGETGQLFSEDHPYYPKNCNGCPFNKGLKNRLTTFFNKKKDCSSCMAIANGITKANSNFDIGESLVKLYSLDNHKLLNEIRKITSSKVFKPVEKNIFSAINDSDNDFERLLDVSRKASSRGYKSYILPNPGRGRTPDIILERKGIFKVYDVKTIIGKNSAGSRLKESIGQTKRVLLHITTDYDARKLAKEIKKYFEINPEALEVLIYRGKKEIPVNKNMIQQSNYINTFIRLYVK